MNKFLHVMAVAMALPAVMLLEGCVDDDYDLSQDIDLTVQIGSDHLTLPGCSTEAYTMKQILNLGGNSSIVADEDGNYRLEQDGEHTSSSFRIDAVNLNEIKNQSDHSDSTPLPSSSYDEGEMVTIVMEGDGSGTNTKNLVHIRQLDNAIDINSSNVPKELISVKSVKTSLSVNVILKFTFSHYSDDVIVVKGYGITFPKDMKVTTTAPYLEVVDGHILQFKEDYKVSQKINGGLGRTFTIPVSVESISVTGNNGIHVNNATGAKTFTFKANVISSGELQLIGASLPTGVMNTLVIESDTEVGKNPQIREVTGRIDPKITVNTSEFEIDEIPGFLGGGHNNLDVWDPQIYLMVRNTSPVQAFIGIDLKSYKQGEVIADVKIPQTIKVEPGMNYICIACRKIEEDDILKNLKITGPTTAHCASYVQEDLNSILFTIPDIIKVTPSARANSDQDYTFALDNEYQFDTDSKAIVPLAFGPNLKIEYTSSEDGWDADLNKFNFKKAIIKAKAVSTIPMNLTPDVKPVFNASDSPSGKIKVYVDGTIEGTPDMSKPATSNLIITLESDGENLNGLDGIEYTFRGEGSPELEGVPLNAKQGVAFESLSITIEGGIIIDLNNNND